MSARERTPVGIVISDVHWRTTTPEYRRETCPFNEVIRAKLAEVAKAARKWQVPVFVTGDLSDRSREFMDYWTLSESLEQEFWTAKSPSLYRTPIYAVPGQHDMFHHTEDEATSFNLLRKHHGDMFLKLDDHPLVLDLDPCGRLHKEDSDEGEEIHVYGAGWGEPIPVPKGNGRPVLILHKTLWYRTPIYPGQKDGNVEVEARKFAELGYEIVFSGDNHVAFDVEVHGVRFVNVGAFTRNSVALKDQRPRYCVLYDDGSIESVKVGEPDVFLLDISDADKGREDEKDEFSAALAGGFEHGTTFKGMLEKIVATGKCGEASLTTGQVDLLRDIVNAI